jgi:hypothetical protein
MVVHNIQPTAFERRYGRTLPIVGGQVRFEGENYLVVARSEAEIMRNVPLVTQAHGQMHYHTFPWRTPTGNRTIWTLRAADFPNPQEVLSGLGRITTPRPVANPQGPDWI